MRLIKIEGGRINVVEPQILPVGGSAVVSGQALMLNNGVIVPVTNTTTKPTFIALANAAANTTVHVARVEPNQIYEVESPGAVVVGTKYALTEDKTGISTTITSGVAEVVYADANVVHVRFS